MALTFKEKRTYQKEVIDNLSKLKAGGLSFKEKRVLQKSCIEIIALLKGNSSGKTGLTLSDQLMAGNFDQKDWLEYISILDKVGVENVLTIEQLQDCVERYVKVHDNEIVWNESADDEKDAESKSA